MEIVNAKENIRKKEIEDVYGRTFKTLRVSLTNICNLACSYCVDATAQNSKTTLLQKTLTTNQYIEIISALHKILALDTVRLTGGEPTLYKELIPLIQGIKNAGIEHIKMTSNATKLADIAKKLKNAGLSAVNISLDAIDEDVSIHISKRNKLQNILEGIDKTIQSGINVKINCVVIKGENETQILKLVEFAKERNIIIRFLELMQMGHLFHNFQQYFFSEAEILDVISEKYIIHPISRATSATSKYWSTEDGYKFGIISNESDPFCNDCNRLRLDSYGNIYGCLSDNHPIKILDFIGDAEEIRVRLTQAIAQKKTKFSGSPLSMLHIGG